MADQTGLSLGGGPTRQTRHWAAVRHALCWQGKQTEKQLPLFPEVVLHLFRQVNRGPVESKGTGVEGGNIREEHEGLAPLGWLWQEPGRLS